MNIYKPPSTNEIYNPSDLYNDDDEDDDDEDANDQLFLNVSGDIMDGRLIIKKDIQFKDFSVQDTAYTNIKDSQISTNISDINLLNIDVGTLTNLVNVNTIGINDLNIDVDNLTNTVNGNVTNINLLNIDLGTLTNLVNVNTIGINDLNIDVDNLTNTVNVNTTSINDLNIDISAIQIKTDVIETVTNSITYQRHRIGFRNSVTGGNQGYIGPVGDSIYIGADGNVPIIINPDMGHIQHYCEYTYFGDNNGSGKLILQNLGSNPGQIIINNEIQSNAYTNADHNNLNQHSTDINNLTNSIVTLNNNINTNTSVISSIINNMYNINDPKIYVKIAPNWNILSIQFITGQNNYGLQSDLYHITNHPSLNIYTDQANGGGPRHFNYPNKKILMVKYSIAYQSSLGNINTFKTRIIKYTNVANEGNVIKAAETLFQGVDFYGNRDFNNIVMFNDSMVFILDNERESIALETQYMISTSNGTTDLKCEIEIIEL